MGKLASFRLGHGFNGYEISPGNIDIDVHLTEAVRGAQVLRTEAWELTRSVPEMVGLNAVL